MIIDDIKIVKSTNLQFDKIDLSKVEFGSIFSDHMFITDYFNGEWHNPRIVPFDNISLSPAALALHYGQTVFEGIKAFRMQDGNVSVFRIDKHLERMNKSLDRMCMPAIPDSLFKEGISKLIATDSKWIPSLEGFSLYLRPAVFASEARLGVKVSEEYKFIVFGGPVGPYYGKPLKLKVETHFVRAAKGGTGYAKCGGNYGASFYPTQKARSEGYDQVLWTDSSEHRFIEESGTMNVMFMINDTLVTPALSDSILDGITRNSVLTIARQKGIKVEERPISIDELQNALKNQTLTEAFGTGTAAVIAIIESIAIENKNYVLPTAGPSSFMMQAKKQLMNMRTGVEPDVFGWNSVIDLNQD